MKENEFWDCISQLKSGKMKCCVFGAGQLGQKVAPKLLESIGVQIDFFCDNNIKVHNQTIIGDIICKSPLFLKDIVHNVVVFVMLGCSYEGDVIKQLRDMGINRIITYQELLDYSNHIYDVFPFMRTKKIVYTCIVGDYDQPPLFSERMEGYDYCLISDKKPEVEYDYIYIDINEIEITKELDLTRKNRYCKINAHKLFPDYKYSIYIDGTIDIKKNLDVFIEELPITRIILAGKLYNDCLYREAMRCIESESDSCEKILHQIKRYWFEGMPEHFGEFWNNVIIREHNHTNCINIMEQWWKEVKTESRRDQISLPYVLWKNGYTRDDIVTVLDGFETDNEYWDFKKSHEKGR